MKFVISGGLGNQLFQVANAISISSEFNSIKPKLVLYPSKSNITRGSSDILQANVFFSLFDLDEILFNSLQKKILKKALTLKR